MEKDSPPFFAKKLGIAIGAFVTVAGLLSHAFELDTKNDERFNAVIQSCVEQLEENTVLPECLSSMPNYEANLDLGKLEPAGGSYSVPLFSSIDELGQHLEGEKRVIRSDRITRTVGAIAIGLLAGGIGFWGSELVFRNRRVKHK